MKIHTTLALILFGALGGTAGACDDAYTPVQWSPSESPPEARVPPGFPPAGSGDVYEGLDTAFDSYRRAVVASRFVLDPSDSTFVLQYAATETGAPAEYAGENEVPYEYAGRYAGADGSITFSFVPNQEQWSATGTIRGDTLAVAYTWSMQLEGFSDGLYLRDPDHGTTRGTSGGGTDALTPCREEIFLAASDGTGAELLVEGSRPTWSPDGSRIAFHRTSDPSWPWVSGEIWVMEVGGGDPVLVGPGRDPSWSPDGRRIAFTSAEGISTMDADGSSVALLLPHDFLRPTDDYDEFIGEPAWSPDGKRIAFEHMGDGDILPHKIFVMDADGSDPRSLTPTDGIQYAEEDPAWSPTGSRIAFWSYGYGIAVVDATGGQPASWLAEKDYKSRLAWSPEGSPIAFTAYVGGDPSCPDREIRTLSGNTLFPDAHDAAWSPDGQRLAFVRTGS